VRGHRRLLLRCDSPSNIRRRQYAYAHTQAHAAKVVALLPLTPVSPTELVFDFKLEIEIGRLCVLRSITYTGGF